jgi:23S rRNA (uracil1939-C5)-methyltransferase
LKNNKIVKIYIDKLVHGGQGIGIYENGKKCFVWGALPGETVEAVITKSRKDYLEGLVESVIEPSQDRIEPKEPEIYLSTSPWQIVNYLKEAVYKQKILEESFGREGLVIDWQDFYQDAREYGYRNKMEYNFWFDKDTSRVSLALHKRGSHLKIPVNGSLLASDRINTVSQELIEFINEKNIEGRQLKSVIIRSCASGYVGLSVFVKDKKIVDLFDDFSIENSGLEIIYSDPKSPASVATELLYSNQDLLTDHLNGIDFKYSTRSFFQVNLPVYEQVLGKIKKYLSSISRNTVIDLYSGVGSIGLTVVGNNEQLIMIETDAEASAQAQENIKSTKYQRMITASAEESISYITGKETIIVDPPRAGLHSKVRSRLIEVKPKEIIYLSCNPSTQARDVKELIDAGYKITSAQGFNFFPRTPHIESLIILSHN